jgi:protein tyrosine phosphatase
MWRFSKIVCDTYLSQRIIEYQDDNLSSLNEDEKDFMLQFAKRLQSNRMKSMQKEIAVKYSLYDVSEWSSQGG